MQGFTKKEATRILDNVRPLCFTSRDNNPYRETFQAALEQSHQDGSITMATIYGICVGMALGIRMERERRRTGRKQGL